MTSAGPSEYSLRMLQVFASRKQEDEELAKSLKPVKEKAPKKKKGKGFKTITAIKLFPGDTFIRDINLIELKIKKE